ncbi:MAG: flavodoxin family protein [Dehalococcoidales bacterium]|nr:flavodoxin family protein [Dehalococcoidales bacterium]
MSAKKVLVVMGSPRKNGNSVILAKSVAKGATAAGGEVESFYLHQMNIKPCDACDACQGENSQGCIINDDMQILYPKLRQADALVIASPVYWFTVAAQTKLFLDRIYALEGSSGNVLQGKRIGIVLTYGDSDPFNSGAVNALRTFQDAFNYIGAPIVGMVYGSALKAGDIKQNRDLMAKARELGRQLVAGE